MQMTRNRIKYNNTIKTIVMLTVGKPIMEQQFDYGSFHEICQQEVLRSN
jgi:hypothetical protein